MKNTFLLILALIFSAQGRANTINITDVGGKGDGKTSNTAIIKNAIEKLSSKGGGTLIFPSGTFVTGPIVMKSNITIDIQAGATIKFSDDFSEYTPFVEMRYEGVVMKSFCPMIYAYEQKNITIKGEGTIDGNGKKWWYGTFTIEGKHQDDKFKKELEQYQAMWRKENTSLSIEEQSDWKRTLAKAFFRPPLMQPYKCKGFKLEGIKIINSPFWTVNPEFCEDVQVSGITIDNPQAPNTDGINPSSCRNVLIANCRINVGDDCITIKSGRDLQGRQYAAPCENITITNCVMLSGHGGVVIGSEMSGDVRRITISNCVFDGTERGIRIKSTRGRGGVVEDIRVSNIVMNNIAKEAITLNLFYSDVKPEPFSERTPVFKNIHISGLSGTNVNMACTILGIEESPISGITLSDIDIDAKTGIEIDKTSDITLDNVRINVQKGSAFKVSDSKDIRIHNSYTLKPLADQTVFEVNNVKDMFVTGCFPKEGSRSFMTLDGSSTNNVVLRGNYFDRIPLAIEKKAGLGKTAKIIDK